MTAYLFQFKQPICTCIVYVHVKIIKKREYRKEENIIELIVNNINKRALFKRVNMRYK